MIRSKVYVNFPSPAIQLAALWKSDRDYRRRPPNVQKWIEEDFGPDVEGKEGEPCPNCSRTRILSVPGRQWWRCCGLRVA